MNITVERQPNCTARLRVEVPAEKVTGERKRILQAFTKQARLPGFRPGHAPGHVIEKRYGPAIVEELETRLIREAVQDAMEQENLRVLDIKAAEDTTHHPDGAFSFCSQLVLAPEFELPDYHGIPLQVPERTVSEDDVERELDGLRQRFADFTDITDRPLQDGDFAVLDYTTELDGQPVAEALEQSAGYIEGGEDFWFKMEEESFLPGFAAALAGATPGEQRAFTLTLPEDFPIDGIAGKDLDFEVTVKSIKDQVLPEWTDELAAQVVPGKTVEELRETVREHLAQQIERQLGELKVNQVIEKLNESVDFELPSELLTAETQGQADQLVEQGLGSGMSEEELASHQGELFAAAGQRARTNLKTEFILQEIARAEDIQVSDQELSVRIAGLAQQSKQPVKAFARELQKSGRLHGLKHSMLLTKTIDFLLDHAKVEAVAEPPATDDTDNPTSAHE
ncbi:MAG: trigger factor [Akkermansiaceae bacterium]|nr:trigger factor [Akkermansiaceae bacterium]NNM31190.1 trigger factor [Akkermansiaceae bacterium]